MDFCDYAWDCCNSSYYNCVENPYVVCMETHTSCNINNCPNKEYITDYITKYNKGEINES